VANAVNNLQSQINNIVIPSNISSIVNIGTNLYGLSGTVGPNNITMAKVLFY
jgi:hypothetical protein